MRVRLVSMMAILLVAGCGESGPRVPVVGALQTACAVEFCVDYPQGWTAETGDTFITLSHPSDPEQVEATLGKVDMERLVEVSQGIWPTSTENVVRVLWDQLGELQDARLDEVTEQPDGSARAIGRLDGRIMWYRLIPVSATDAVGVAFRAPDLDWSDHADTVLDSVVVTSG